MKMILLAIAIMCLAGCLNQHAAGRRFRLVDKAVVRALMDDEKPVLLTLPEGCEIIVVAERQRSKTMAMKGAR